MMKAIVTNGSLLVRHKTTSRLVETEYVDGATNLQSVGLWLMDSVPCVAISRHHE